MKPADRRQPDRSAPFRQVLALGALLTLIVLGVAFSFGHEAILTEADKLAAWIESLGAWAPLMVVALMIVHCFIPFPAEVLALCAGSIFGTVAGTGLIWLGAMIGAVLSFGLARLLGRGAVLRFLSRRQAESLDAWTADQGALTLLVSRFIPIIAFNLINYAAGLTRVSWWTFLWTTAVGILPLTILMVYLGAAMRTLRWEWLLVVSACGIVTVWSAHRLARRRGWVGRQLEHRARPD